MSSATRSLAQGSGLMESAPSQAASARNPDRTRTTTSLATERPAITLSLSATCEKQLAEAGGNRTCSRHLLQPPPSNRDRYLRGPAVGGVGPSRTEFPHSAPVF